MIRYILKLNYPTRATLVATLYGATYAGVFAIAFLISKTEINYLIVGIVFVIMSIFHLKVLFYGKEEEGN